MLDNDRYANRTASSDAIRRAAMAGDAELAAQIGEACLESGSHIGRSPYSAALRMGHAAAAAALLKAGFSRLKTDGLIEGLEQACSSGDDACFQLAAKAAGLTSKAKAKPLLGELGHVLGRSAAQGRLAWVERLLALGVRPDPPDTENDREQAHRDKNGERRGAPGQSSALVLACHHGHLDCAWALAKAGAEIDRPASEGMDKEGQTGGWTAIGLALRRGDAATFSALIQMGANLGSVLDLPRSRMGMRTREPFLLIAADQRAAEKKDDRFLRLLAEAGLPMELSCPASASFAAFALAAQERVAIAAAAAAPHSEAPDSNRL